MRNRCIKIKLADAVIALCLTACIFVSIFFLALGGADAKNVLFDIADYKDFLQRGAALGRLSASGFVKRNDMSLAKYYGAIKNSGEINAQQSYLTFYYDDTRYAYDGKNVVELLDGSDIEGESYVFANENNRYGVKNIKGGVIVDCIYDAIALRGDTAVAQLDEVFYVFFKGELQGASQKRVEICKNSRFVSVDAVDRNLFFDLEKGFVNPYNPLSLSGTDYVLLCEPEKNSGVFLYYNALLDRIGLAIDSMLLTQPIFYTASYFEGGCSYVEVLSDDQISLHCLRYADGEVRMINLSELRLENARFAPFYGRYAVFFDTQKRLYGVVDLDFNVVVAPIFKNLHEQVMGDYVLDLTQGTLFSIVQGTYVDISGSFMFCDGFFICFSQGSYSIFDSQLNLLVGGCDFAFYFLGTKTLLAAIGNQIYHFDRI